MPSGLTPPPSLIARVLSQNQWTRFLYNHWRRSIGIFGVTGALGVVWLFDVQLSDYLIYVPVFKKKFEKLAVKAPPAEEEEE